MKSPRVFAAAAALFLFACSGDIDERSQLPGQRCLRDLDCAPGLACHDRVCTPVLDHTESDAGGDAGEEDTGPTMCEVGARWCVGNDALYCTPDQEVESQECAIGSVCRDGACLPVGPDCIDEDRDGYGVNCNFGPDCDDTNPNVHPNRPEECGNGIDDNCDGQIDEGCTMSSCCEGGCGSNEFCSNACVCTAYNPTVCTTQDQPCEFEGEITNGYICLNLGDQPRCWGICDMRTGAPDTTCPQAGTTCAFPTAEDYGFCATSCSAGSCGADSMGCMPWENNADAGGVCVPTGPASLGEACDTDVSFACTEGLLCVADNFGGGTCQQVCRPFANEGAQTDCSAGQHCLAVASSVGLCAPDNASSEGEACGPSASTCGEDSVACFNMGNGQTCTRFCRLREGDVDCADGKQCRQYDFNNTDLGYCN